MKYMRFIMAISMNNHAQAFVPINAPKHGLRAGFQDDVDRFVAGFQAFLFKDRLKEHAKECRAINMELNKKLQAAQWAFVEENRRAEAERVKREQVATGALPRSLTSQN